MKNKTNKLDATGNVNPFKVPEGYFENFPDFLMDKLPEKAIPEPVVVNMWDRIKPWAYMAAMFIGIALMVKIFVGNPASEESGIFSGNIELTPVSEIDEFYSYYEDQMAYAFYRQAVNFPEEILDNFEDAEEY